MDATTKQLLRAKDQEILRLAETVLRINEVLQQARSIDTRTVDRLNMLNPEVEHAHRTFTRLADPASEPT